MAAALTSDSDGEFGYDFSPEEEQFMWQLASPDSIAADTSLSPAAHPGLTVPLTEGTGNGAAVDLVPGKTESIDGDGGVTKFQHARPLELVASLPPRAAAADHRAPLDGTQPRSVSLPQISLLKDVQYPNRKFHVQRVHVSGLTDLEHQVSRALSDLEANNEAVPQVASDSKESDEVQDERSPLQRFRSYPRKPLTVTDLTSGAWCELQYWYTLTRLPGGRRTRTPAMVQGSKMHQQLEDEVHTTVQIDILSKEDGFGLRLWNLVQGLRTLRDKGLTRELEIWGMIDGNLVNGVIDGVSYENPNPEFEEELSSSQESQRDQRQPVLSDYFPPKKIGGPAQSGPKIYLTDVKTRGSRSAVSPAILRPAKIQLLLYHRFLSDMAAGRLDLLKVVRRYGLDADDPFSDSFIAQIGGLHDEIFVDAPSSSEDYVDKTDDASHQDTGNPQDAAEPARPDLVKYRTLRELLKLVRMEIQLTFPHGERSLGHMLNVQYVYRANGRQLDSTVFPASKQALDEFLARYMEWWRGERKPDGVDIEEAFKCRTCEFAAGCSWRQEMDQDRVKKARRKMQDAKASATKS